MNEELTPWFPDTVKPVRKGVYLIKEGGLCEGMTLYSYFDGEKWGWFSKYMEDALSEYMGSGDFTNDGLYEGLVWRGLANNPNKKVSK